MTASEAAEQLVFPGLGRDGSLRLERALEAAAEGAGLFGRSLSGMDVHVSWSLGRPRPTRWMRARDGRLAVHIWVDLLAPENRPGPVAGPEAEGSIPAAQSAPGLDLRRMYMDAFRAGVLHQLGRVVYSPGPLDSPVHPVDSVLHPGHPEGSRLPGKVRSRLEEWEVRRALRGIWDYLEGARTDAVLVERFRGAARRLEGRVRVADRAVEGGDPVRVAVAVCVLLLRRRGEGVAERASAVDVDRLLSALGEGVDRVGAASRAAPQAASQREGSYRLAEFVVYSLGPFLLSLTDEPARAGEEAPVLETTEPGEPDWAADDLERAEERRAGGLTFFSGRTPEIDTGEPGALVDTRPVRLPHVEGGLVTVRVEHARARDLEPDDVTRAVLREVRETYGDQALSAFRDEAAPLRRALAVNHERRHRGRYRAGKHVGTSNLRRYVLRNDVRLFQRLEVPAELSYYFHIVVDVSYSMLEGHNMQKALATTYAFTSLLTSFGVPVDVTLYSSGMTELFDHRTDVLEEYFGREFGFLVSGTLEMEALGYAKTRIDRVNEEHKILVVITDGTPVGSSLPAVGAADLATYYRETLLPWFSRSGVEVVALGLGIRPSYHVRAMVLDEGWDAVPFFLGLIEEMVREQSQESRALWS